MDGLKKILVAFERHDAAGIKAAFEQGIDPDQMHDGKPLVHHLIDMYARGPAFKACIKAFVDHGLHFEDKALLAVLLNDADALDALLSADQQLLNRTYSFQCAFTPLYEAGLLHLCAEYNHLACARTLVKHGADVNAKAGIDANGFGGHTPIFHTVNQDANKCVEVMKYLIDQQADLSLTVKGLIWGKGYDWETFIPCVNPISYAMMGLLRQFQRSEAQIYEIVSLLLHARYGLEYRPGNIPNTYLNP
ncbi:MAG: ankyrin repeat domain-containing protein [Flavobacteriaceae bacterium]